MKLWKQLRSGNQLTQFAAMRALLGHDLGTSEVHDTVEFLDKIVHGAHWWKSGDSGREEADMYQQTAQALGKLGKDAAVAIPVLRRHAKDKHVSHAAADAIGQMDKAGIMALRQMVKSSFNIPCTAAVRALGGLGLAARPAIPDLEEAASSSDSQVQCAALEALRDIRALEKEMIKVTHAEVFEQKMIEVTQEEVIQDETCSCP